MKKSKLIRKWAIPGLEWRIKLMQKPNGMYYVRMQPFTDREGLSSKRWYSFTYQREFATELGASRAILDHLDGGNL